MKKLLIELESLYYKIIYKLAYKHENPKLVNTGTEIEPITWFDFSPKLTLLGKIFKVLNISVTKKDKIIYKPFAKVANFSGTVRQVDNNQIEKKATLKFAESLAEEIREKKQ